MRITLSLMCVIGIALMVASISLPWLVRDYDDTPPGEGRSSETNLLTDFDYWLGSDPSEFLNFAYSTALYLMVVGLAISITSMLGGFVALAGVCTFTVGGAMGDNPLLTFGTSPSGSVAVYPGIGFYLGIVAAAIIIASIVFPLEVGIDKGAPRPRFRTWHLSLAPKAPRPDQAGRAQ